MSSTRRLALFDLDFTLLPQDTMFLFANFVLRKKPWRLLYLAVFAGFVPLRLLGVINEVPLKRAFFSFLWRLPAGEIDALAREFVECDVVPRIYPELREILAAERGAGHSLVLNTASPYFFVRYVAQALDFDYVFASPLDVFPGSLPADATGAVRASADSAAIKGQYRAPLLARFRGPNNKGQQKIHALRAAGLLPPANFDASEARAAFHITPDPHVAMAATDSTADLPMLAVAPRGILIHPKPEKFARKTGQPIAGFSEWTVHEPARPYSGRHGDVKAALRQMFGLYPPPA